MRKFSPLVADNIEAVVVPQKGLKLVSPKEITKAVLEHGIEIESKIYSNLGTLDKPIYGPEIAASTTVLTNPYSGEAVKEVTYKEFNRRERQILGTKGILRETDIEVNIKKRSLILSKRKCHLLNGWHFQSVCDDPQITVYRVCSFPSGGNGGHYG